MRSIAFLLIASITLAGCSSGIEESPGTHSEDETPSDPGPSPEAPESPETPDDPETPAPEDVAPTLSLSPSVAEGEVPFNLTLEIDVDDEDGDEVAWTLYLGDSELESGTGSAEPVISIEEEGNHTLRVVAESGDKSVEDSLVVRGVEPPPRIVKVDDKPDDARADFLEIETAEFELTESALRATLKIKDVVGHEQAGPPQAIAYWIDVGGKEFATWYYISGTEEPTDMTLLFDIAADGYLDEGLATWDSEADTVMVDVPFAVLDGHGLAAPYEVKAYSVAGLLLTQGQQTVVKEDAAPDSGTVTLG